MICNSTNFICYRKSKRHWQKEFLIEANSHSEKKEIVKIQRSILKISFVYTTTVNFCPPHVAGLICLILVNKKFIKKVAVVGVFDAGRPCLKSTSSIICQPFGSPNQCVKPSQTHFLLGRFCALTGVQWSWFWCPIASRPLYWTLSRVSNRADSGVR